jgi:hypothetical protein
MTKRELRNSRFTEDGLPKDGREWTVDDWRDLHEAMETVKRKVSERHARPVPTSEGTQGTPLHGA